MENNEQNSIYFKPAAKLLVVDDSHLNRSFIGNAFLSPNYEVLAAVDGNDGIAKTKEFKPELILLDIMMPGMDGFETAKILKNDPATRDIPVIFITALDAIQDKLRAFEVGGVDFVTKPFNHKELIARVKTHIELRRSTDQKQRMLTIAMEEKRNASIARIAAGVSHNFNNMLGVSFGNIMFVESMIGKSLDPIAKEALTDVRKSLERMQALVKQFLVLANRSGESKGKPQPAVFNIDTIVEESLSTLVTLKANGTYSLDVKCKSELPKELKVYCDSGHIHESIYLILNEVVETSAGKASCTIEQASGNTPGYVDIAICVSGIPSIKNIGDSIFEPFALPIANVGAGLSFSVAKHLIELNGGKIEATFPQNEGIVFNIKLPSPKEQEKKGK